MKFNISLRIDTNAEHKADVINSLSISLKEYFKDKYYGDGIMEISINCICVNVPSRYEHLFKTNKPLYIENKLIANKFTGELIELDKAFLFDMKFNSEDYEDFITQSDEESKKILGVLLFKSLGELEKLPKKIKNFEKDKLIHDFQDYLKSTELL